MGTSASPATAPPSLKHMVRVPGGMFLMGSERKNGPSMAVAVDGFWIDAQTHGVQ